MRKFTILSIDGGGIRGVIPAVILAYLEKQLQLRSGNANATLSDYFDMIAGTSTGGILACLYRTPPREGQALHSRYSAAEAVSLYAEHGAEIFSKRFPYLPITRALYGAEGLESVLHRYLGDITLADTPRHTLVTAYDITERRAVLFTTAAARANAYRNYRLRDIARATSAAPTYFAPAHIASLGGDTSCLVDGGIYAGNPTMCAVLEAHKSVFPEWKADTPPAVNDLYVVSLGTGTQKRSYRYADAKGWGALGWLSPMLDLLLSASAEVVHFQLRQLFAASGCAASYHRLEPAKGEADSDMDNAKPANIAALRAAGEKFIAGNLKRLDFISEQLRVKRESGIVNRRGKAPLPPTIPYYLIFSPLLWRGRGR